MVLLLVSTYAWPLAAQVQRCSLLCLVVTPTSKHSARSILRVHVQPQAKWYSGPEGISTLQAKACKVHRCYRWSSARCIAP